MSEDRTLSTERVAELLERGDAQVVDVRDDQEYAAGHLAAARHAPFDRLETVPSGLDRSATVIFYCRGGDRSATAADAFAASGWDAYHLEGGLLAWAQQSRPLEPPDGWVAERSGLPPA